MSTDTKTTTEKDNAYESIIKYAHFGLNLASTIGYGVEKVKRLPEIRLENSFSDSILDAGPVEKIKTPIETVLAILGYTAHICNGIKYVTTVLGFVGGGITIAGIKLDKVPSWLRMIVQFLIVFALMRIALRVVGKHKDYLLGLKKKWDWPISLLSKGGGFVFGIFQLYLFFKAKDIPGGKQVFLLSSIADSLTAPLDLKGVDNMVLNIPIPKGEIVYAVLYGGRVIMKSVKTVGVLTD